MGQYIKSWSCIALFLSYLMSWLHFNYSLQLSNTFQVNKLRAIQNQKYLCKISKDSYFRKNMKLSSTKAGIKSSNFTPTLEDSRYCSLEPSITDYYSKEESEPHKSFRSFPDLRKIALAYINNKFSDEMCLNSKVVCSEDNLRRILSQILPPVPTTRLNQEIINIVRKLNGELYIEKRKLGASLLLDNSIWEEVGEVVVKERMLLDYLSADDLSKVGFTATSASVIETSLIEDGSGIVKFTKDDAKLAVQLIHAVNGVSTTESNVIRLKENIVIPFFLKADMFEPYDNYGNPTILMLLMDSLREKSW